MATSEKYAGRDLDHKSVPKTDPGIKTTISPTFANILPQYRTLLVSAFFQHIITTNQYRILNKHSIKDSRTTDINERPIIRRGSPSEEVTAKVVRANTLKSMWIKAAQTLKAETTAVMLTYHHRDHHQIIASMAQVNRNPALHVHRYVLTACSPGYDLTQLRSYRIIRRNVIPRQSILTIHLTHEGSVWFKTTDMASERGQKEPKEQSRSS